jgi:hypothetical protein
MSTIASLLNAIDSGKKPDQNRITQAIIKKFGNNTPKLDGKDLIVFFPLRLETRFEKSNIKVRVFPDEMLINQHKTGLSDNEIRAGKYYWRERNEAKKLAKGYEAKKEYLWNNVAALYSPQRASWIIRQTRPQNWIEWGVNDDLEFPDAGELKKNQVPQHLLPTHLVLIMETELNDILVTKGKEIPADLVLAPEIGDVTDPPFSADSENAGGLSRSSIRLADSIAWMSEFKYALDKGMAFEIPVGNVSKINWLMVVGVREGLSGDKGSQALESLLESHYYTTKGLSLVPQGTPTNNSEEANSGYEQRASVKPEDYLVYNPDKSIQPQPQDKKEQKTDQQRLAEYLGIDFGNSILGRTGPHRRAASDDRPNHNGLADAREAALMHTALYPATLGYYTKYALNSSFSEALSEKLRRFYLDHVSGRGSLPALRRGRQPYGWVLCGDIKNIKPLPDQEVIHRFVQFVEREVTKLAYQTTHVGQKQNANGSVADETGVMEKLLQQFPASVRYFQRTLENPEQDNTFKTSFFNQLWKTLVDPNANVDSNQLLLSLVENKRTDIHLSVCYEDEPLSESAKSGEISLKYLEYLESSLSKQVNTHLVSPPPNYLELLLNWSLGGGISLEGFAFFENKNWPLLFYLLRSALLRQMGHCVNLWLAHEGIAVVGNPGQVLVPMDYLLIGMETLYGNKVSGAEQKYNIINYIINLKFGTQIANYEQIESILQIDAEVFNKVLDIQGDRKALEAKLINNKNYSEPLYEAYLELLEIFRSLYVLASMPTARLERCFAEHLDTLTYRSDAWITGLLSQQLEALRVNNPAGVQIGAYGWLLDIRRQSKSPADGGYIHAPSLAKAATGALLKNGFKKYRFNDGAFAVDLSSDRVRRGMFLLEGLQEGYELPALLGYQFERAMHDGGLEIELAALKSKYPLKNKRFIDNNNPITGTVIDGLQLIREKSDIDVDKIKNSIIPSLEESLDALSDILTAEAVHQYTNGNMERAASVLKSLSEGSSPPVPEFVQTNRSSKHHITHRVCVLMKESGTIAGTATPRAQAAPELNHWLDQKIGALDQIKFTVFEKADDGSFKNEKVVNLREFNLQPIDLVYIVPSGLISGDTPVPVGNEEWGRRIAKIYKDEMAGAAVNDAKIWVDYDKATTGIRFSEKYFMLLKLRELVSNARPLHGGYLTNPVKGYELEQLKAKYDNINKNLNDLKYPDDSIKDLLKTLSAQDYPKDYTAEKVEQTKDIVNILQQASLYGYTDANAGIINPDSVNNPMAVVMAYVSTRKAIEARINEADNLLNFDDKTPLEEKVEKYLKAIRLLFNETVCPLLHFKLNEQIADKINEVERDRSSLLQEAIDAAQKRTEDIVIDDWIDGLHHVRPHVGTYRWVRLLAQRSKLSNPGLKVWQLPYNKNERWLGVPHSTPQSGNKTSLVVESQDAVNNTDAFCGLLIDEWVETIPSKEETTGIAFNYNKPNAEPPQALLLAVPSDPSSGEWGLPEIARSVLYALKLSAIRGIDQDALTQSAWRAFLPAVVGESADQLIAPILFRNNEL